MNKSLLCSNFQSSSGKVITCVAPSLAPDLMNFHSDFIFVKFADRQSASD